MKNRFSGSTIAITIALIASTVLACDLSLGDLGQISFFSAPTPSRTRTPRPTFTPRVELTATPEDTATPVMPALTDTPAATATRTRAPVVVAPRTPTRAAPPPPQLPVKLVLSYPCNDPGGPVWEVIGSIRKPGSVWLGNYVMAIFSPDGRLLKKATSVGDEEKVNALDISCQRSGVLPYNVKIDAGELRTMGALVLRVIKSDTDATPLSPNVDVNFSQPVRWFVFFDVP